MQQTARLLPVVLLFTTSLLEGQTGSSPTERSLKPRKARTGHAAAKERPSTRSVDRFVILLKGGTPATVRRAHETIARHADGYWHQVDNAWIVGGGTASTWRNRLKSLSSDSNVRAVLVLRLPDPGRRAWAAQSGDAFCKWLHSDYTNKRAATAKMAARGQIRTQKTWNNGSEPLGARSYVLGLQVTTTPSRHAVLTYRGSRLVISRRGQTFHIRPYANTSATVTVRDFALTDKGLRVRLELAGLTRNPSVVFSNGYRHAFTGDVTISGVWTPVGLRVSTKERHMWRGLGNAQWEGSGVLRK